MKWLSKIPKSAAASGPIVESPPVGAPRKRTPADNPIRDSSQDLLGRTKAANSFANQILRLDPSGGVVVGVLGPWGSGKTSFVNLASNTLKHQGVSILEFNPWMFSGADQLVAAFFAELASQLKLRPDLSEVGELIEGYGEALSDLGWIPVVGPWIERAKVLAKLAGNHFKGKKLSISQKKAQLAEVLGRLPGPIVVTLDDIDRLSTDEIRLVFKLVRLTACFPNIIYVLAFDRNRVEKALEEQGVPGRDYLEKILQLVVDLPAVPESILTSQITTAVGAALSEIENHGHFDREAWPDVFFEVIRPLIRNMRDVRRYVASVRGTVEDLGKQVALVDVLALEAIRVFLPDVFHQLHAGIDALTAPSRDYHYDEKDLQIRIQAIVDAGKEREEVVRSLIERVFPGGARHIGGSHFGVEWEQTWLRERLVANKLILSLYLERTVGEKLQWFTEAERAWALIESEESLGTFLNGLDAGGLNDVIEFLEAYEAKFEPKHAIPASIVLLNILPKLPEQRGFFDLGSDVTVGRVVLRLLRVLKSSSEVEEAVRRILPRVVSLYSQYELITLVGYRNGAGHELVSSDFAEECERQWRAKVRSTDSEKLATEKKLFWILHRVKSDAASDEPELDLPLDPDLTLAVLQSAKHESASQSLGSRAVRHEQRLNWDGLKKLYGDEASLHRSIAELRESKPEDAKEILLLVDKYLAGWRPRD